MRLPTLTLAFIVAILAFVAYFPFDWDPPHIARNDVTRTSEGNLRFGEQNYARSDGSPEWLGAVQKAGHLTINLEALPYFPQRHAPASIMMLAQDFWHTSFAIGQDDANLMLWLKRPGSTDNGDPPFTIPEVFRPNHWTRVQVEIAGMRLRVIVDGKVKLDERLSPGTLSSWHGGRVALGDEVHGGKGWWRNTPCRGDYGTTVDYVRSDALCTPLLTFRITSRHLRPRRASGSPWGNTRCPYRCRLSQPVGSPAGCRVSATIRRSVSPCCSQWANSASRKAWSAGDLCRRSWAP